MVASLALPLTLFVFASAVSWVSINENRRSRKSSGRSTFRPRTCIEGVQETIDRSLSEIATEIIHGIPDAGIVSREQTLHLRLKQLADSLPQMKSAWIFDANGAVRWSIAWWCLPPTSTSPTAIISRPISPWRYRDLHRRRIETAATLSGRGVLRRFSRRRSNEDGSFAGVIQASSAAGIFPRISTPGSAASSGKLLCARPDRRHRAGPLPCPRSRAAPRPQWAGRAKDRREPQCRSHDPEIAGRRHRTAARISAARRISDLHQRRP